MIKHEINKPKSYKVLYDFFFFQNLLQPSSAPLPEYKTAALKKSRFVLSHYGLFKSCWDWLILIATVYVAIVVPYNASFVVNADKPSMVSDVIVEALFIVGEFNCVFIYLWLIVEHSILWEINGSEKLTRNEISFLFQILEASAIIYS